jgi:hypothetical protein
LVHHRVSVTGTVGGHGLEAQRLGIEVELILPRHHPVRVLDQRDVSDIAIGRWRRKPRLQHRGARTHRLAMQE